MPSSLKNIRLAISPCPNDTFLFEGLVGDLLAQGGSVQFLDIAELNALHSLGNPPDVIKISCASAPLFLDRYRLLRCGGAFADAVGPLVLQHPQKLGAGVVLPGWRTSAHILWRFWRDEMNLGTMEEEFHRFDQIPPLVATGRFLRGVVIHESRFTFGEMGLVAEADLGAFWEQRTRCPVPLGCLVVRKDRGEAFARDIAQRIVESAQQALDRQDPVTPFIASHASEMSPEVQRRHIQTYVTKRSVDCGVEGLQSLEQLWTLAETKIAPWSLDSQARRSAIDNAVSGL